METRFGADFTGVRVSDQPALPVRAVTEGETITLAQGQGNPETADGRLLLAHELAHVVQQRRPGGLDPRIGARAPLEADAQQTAEAAVSGRPVTVREASAVGPAARGWFDDLLDDAGAVIDNPRSALDTAARRFDAAAQTVSDNVAGAIGTVTEAAEATGMPATLRSRYGDVRGQAADARSALHEAVDQSRTPAELARPLSRWARAQVDADSGAGKGVHNALAIVDHLTDVGGDIQRRSLHALIDGDVAGAVSAIQEEVDTRIMAPPADPDFVGPRRQTLHELVDTFVEGYEDTGYGVPDALAAGPVLAPTVAALDTLTDGAVSRGLRQAQGGLGKSIYTMGEGLVGLAVHPLDAAQGLSELTNPTTPIRFAADAGSAALNYAMGDMDADEALAQLGGTPYGALLDGVTQRYQHAVASGRYMEIPGLLVGDVGSVFVGGPATKGTALRGTTAAARASPAVSAVGHAAPALRSGSGVARGSGIASSLGPMRQLLSRGDEASGIGSLRGRAAPQRTGTVRDIASAPPQRGPRPADRLARGERPVSRLPTRETPAVHPELGAIPEHLLAELANDLLVQVANDNAYGLLATGTGGGAPIGRATPGPVASASGAGGPRRGGAGPRAAPRAGGGTGTAGHGGSARASSRPLPAAPHPTVAGTNVPKIPLAEVPGGAARQSAYYTRLRETGLFTEAGTAAHEAQNMRPRGRPGPDLPAEGWGALVGEYKTLFRNTPDDLPLINKMGEANLQSLKDSIRQQAETGLVPIRKTSVETMAGRGTRVVGPGGWRGLLPDLSWSEVTDLFQKYHQAYHEKLRQTRARRGRRSGGS